MTSARRVSSPLGPLLIRCTPFGVESLAFTADRAVPVQAPSGRRERELLEHAAAWIEEYFASPGQAPRSKLPTLAPDGTAFERDVWRALGELPYGAVVSYGTIAVRLGRSRGTSRAVGQANGKNPLPIFVPCHRVVAAGGKLGGYSAGLDRKQWLLAHEGVTAFAAPARIVRAESYGVF